MGAEIFILRRETSPLAAHRLRQIGDVNDRPVDHHASIANDILKFADVAGPVIESHTVLRAACYAGDRFVV